MAGSIPQAHLSRRYRFSASHRLHVAGMSANENHALFGKCNNPHGHGHNYTVQVTLSGPVEPETGMVVDLRELDRFVQHEVLDRFDQANLNQDAAFQRCPPSTENVAMELWRVFEEFVRSHASVALRRVRVEETKNNAFDYCGKGEPLPLSGGTGYERASVSARTT